MKKNLITYILIACIITCLLGNCYQFIMYHRLLGTINNLKTSLNITNDRITELENKYNNLQEAVAIMIMKPSENKRAYSIIQSMPTYNYQMNKPYIPDSNYFEIQKQNDKLKEIQRQTDEINKKLRDDEIQKDAERLARPSFMF